MLGTRPGRSFFTTCACRARSEHMPNDCVSTQSFPLRPHTHPPTFRSSVRRRRRARDAGFTDAASDSVLAVVLLRKSLIERGELGARLKYKQSWKQRLRRQPPRETPPSPAASRRLPPAPIWISSPTIHPKLRRQKVRGAGVRGRTSFFLHKLGIKVISAKSKVEIRAQAGNIEVTTQKKLILVSLEEIIFKALKATIITDGASYEIEPGGF